MTHSAELVDAVNSLILSLEEAGYTEGRHTDIALYISPETMDGLGVERRVGGISKINGLRTKFTYELPEELVLAVAIRPGGELAVAAEELG